MLARQHCVTLTAPLVMFGIEFFVCFTDVMLEINWITLLDGLFLTELAMFHQVRETT